MGTGRRDQLDGYTEIYHVKNQSITMGPQMPFGPLHGASSTPFGNTFLVAGGSKPLEGDEESTGTFSHTLREGVFYMYKSSPSRYSLL